MDTGNYITLLKEAIEDLSKLKTTMFMVWSYNIVKTFTKVSMHSVQSLSKFQQRFISS